jgi:hypothetical protein
MGIHKVVLHSYSVWLDHLPGELYDLEQSWL